MPAASAAAGGTAVAAIAANTAKNSGRGRRGMMRRNNILTSIKAAEAIPPVKLFPISSAVLLTFDDDFSSETTSATVDGGTSDSVPASTAGGAVPVCSDAMPRCNSETTSSAL